MFNRSSNQLVPNMRVLLKVEKGSTLEQLAAQVRSVGGRAIQLFPPLYLIAEVPDLMKIDRGATFDPLDLTGLDPQARSAASVFRRMTAPAAATAPAAPESWDAPGKTPPRFDQSTPLQGEAPTRLMSGPVALSTGTPTSRFLAGRVAVAIVVVYRDVGTGATPNPEHLSDGERDTVTAEAGEAFAWLSGLEPRARVEFAIERHDVQLAVAADPAAADLEALWRDPALAQLGYASGQSGYAALARDVRDRNLAAWGYVLFVTRYPVWHFAYASAERVVQHFDNDGWGVANLNRVIAHESCHLFGTLDEYTSSGCNCTDTSGELAVSNGNCRGCATAFVDCVMEANTIAICDYTRGQLGWREPLIGAQSSWVTALYADLLGRAPDGGGYGYWIATLRGGDHGEVAYGFLRSSEYSTRVVRDAYRRFLDREGEPDGVAYWSALYAAGVPEQAIMHGFLESAEYQANQPDAPTFVESLYGRLLGRASDPAGKDSWVALMASGAARTTIVDGFLRSREYAERTASNYYQTFLARGPDPEGLDAWSTLIANGTALQEIIHGFCTSPEYIQRASTRGF